MYAQNEIDHRRSTRSTTQISHWLLLCQALSSLVVFLLLYGTETKMNSFKFQWTFELESVFVMHCRFSLGYLHTSFERLGFFVRSFVRSVDGIKFIAYFTSEREYGWVNNKHTYLHMKCLCPLHVIRSLVIDFMCRSYSLVRLCIRISCFFFSRVH